MKKFITKLEKISLVLRRFIKEKSINDESLIEAANSLDDCIKALKKMDLDVGKTKWETFTEGILKYFSIEAAKEIIETLDKFFDSM